MVEDDENLWDLITRDIKPIARDKPLSDETRHATRPKNIHNNPPDLEDRQVERPQQRASTSNQAHAGAGLDRKTAEKLRKGQIPLEGRLDLHGMNQSQAHRALEDFIINAHASDKRCVLVITGKGPGEDGRRDPLSSGQGVLKRRAAEWLAAKPLSGIVLRAVPAQPKHGGSGALYVLLKRQR